MSKRQNVTSVATIDCGDFARRVIGNHVCQHILSCYPNCSHVTEPAGAVRSRSRVGKDSRLPRSSERLLRNTPHAPHSTAGRGRFSFDAPLAAASRHVLVPLNDRHDEICMRVTNDQTNRQRAPIRVAAPRFISMAKPRPEKRGRGFANWLPGSSPVKEPSYVRSINERRVRLS